METYAGKATGNCKVGRNWYQTINFFKINYAPKNKHPIEVLIKKQNKTDLGRTEV